MLDEELPPSRSRKPSVATRSGRRRGQARAVQMKRRISLGSERHYASLRPNANVVSTPRSTPRSPRPSRRTPRRCRPPHRTRPVSGLDAQRRGLSPPGALAFVGHGRRVVREAPSPAASAHHRHLCRVASPVRWRNPGEMSAPWTANGHPLKFLCFARTGGRVCGFAVSSISPRRKRSRSASPCCASGTRACCWTSTG
jgi:hypothetical protein